MPRKTRVVLTSLIVLALTATATITATAEKSEAANPITFTYWGDSITARDDSWLAVMQDTDPRFQSVGGYAHSGYRADQVLPYAKPYDSDVTVIELGTNDINQGMRASVIEANIASIVAKVGGDHVLIIATPPANIRSGGCCNTDRTTAGFEFNRWLSGYSANKGWMFADPFQFVREYDNTYTPGSDIDGVHPTATTNLRVEKLIGLFIQQAKAGSYP